MSIIKEDMSLKDFSEIVDSIVQNSYLVNHDIRLDLKNFIMRNMQSVESFRIHQNILNVDELNEKKSVVVEISLSV